MARVRITGISSPWFGVSWEYLESDADVVRRVLTFLENRRILFEPLNTQILLYVSNSAADIREMLTRELSAGRLGEHLATFLKDIRAALRKFMTDLERIELERDGPGDPMRLIHDQQILALGEMRGRVNPILALLADKYHVEVEQELAAALQPLE